MGLQTNIADSDITERFGYHRATSTTGPLHQEIRENYMMFARFLNRVLPDGRAKSVAFTELENSSMWANKAIAEMSPVVEE